MRSGGDPLPVAPPSVGFAVGLSLIAAAVALDDRLVAGRSVDQWAPLVFDWTVLKLFRQQRYRSADPFTGSPAAALPPSIADCRLLAHPLADERELGVVHDQALNAYTAVLAVRMRALGLLAADEQEQRLDAWGRTLASLAGDRSSVRRVQLLERTVPCDPDELLRHFEDHGSTEQPEVRSPIVELLDSATQVAQDHELLVAIQVEDRRAARSGESGPTALAREMHNLVHRLQTGEIAVLGLLDAEQLRSAIRLGFDPYRRRGSVVPGAGPTAADTAWSSYRADGAVHRTYWVAEWPRAQVGPSFFTPLLLGVQAVRSVSIVFDPVPPGRSRAAVEAAITSDEADEQVREERGFRLTARRRRQADSARQREEELADGHEEMRFAGFVTVSGRDEDELAAACAELEHAAQRAFLVLEPLWGQQDVGLAFAALPLARGLRSSRPWSVSA